jgi:hypothetical protein
MEKAFDADRRCTDRDFLPDTTMSDWFHVGQQAEWCSTYMRRNNILFTKTIGRFGMQDIKQNDIVKVKKGSQLYGFAKGMGYKDGGKLTGRDYKVKVSIVYDGYATRDHDRITIKYQQIEWAGRGGYWVWTDCDNVEKIS